LSDPSVADVVDEAPVWSAPFGAALLERVILRRGITALDVCCGTGSRRSSSRTASAPGVA
jgi:hypothetical protein